MFAFQVELETIHDVCTAWLRYAKRPMDMNALGRDLICMNADAVHWRYADHPDADMDRDATYDDAARYQWEPSIASIHQLAKSVDCLIYQCSEGPIMDRPQYDALTALAECIPVDREGPTYANASWSYWEKYHSEAS